MIRYNLTHIVQRRRRVLQTLLPSKKCFNVSNKTPHECLNDIRVILLDFSFCSQNTTRSVQMLRNRFIRPNTQQGFVYLNH